MSYCRVTGITFNQSNLYHSLLQVWVLSNVISRLREWNWYSCSLLNFLKTSMFSEPYQTRSFTSFTLPSLSLPLRLSQNPTAHFSTLIFAILLSLPPRKWLILIKMHMLTSAPDFSSSLSLIYAFFLTLSLHLSPTTSPLSLSLSLLSCSVLRGWGQWRMAQVAMTTPGALTARMASMEAANSCVSSSSCPSKMTPVPATCSCFAGENNSVKRFEGCLRAGNNASSRNKLHEWYSNKSFLPRAKWDTYMGNNRRSFAITKSRLDEKTSVRDYILKSIVTSPIVTINLLLISRHISSILALDWSLWSTYYSQF